MGTTSSNFLPTVTGQDLGATGQRWDLFAQNLDVSGNQTVSGNLSVTGTSSFTGATTLSGILSPKNLDTIRFADQFASIKAAYDDGPSTGVWVIVPAGARTETVQLVLTAGKPLRLTGSGQDATNITWNTSGYWISLAATDVTDCVTIENLSITTGSTATGAIGVGSTSTNFAEANFRRGWAVRNVTFYGPGATTVGSIGMSLTQLIGAQFDNVTVRNFEQPWIWDRGANSLFNRVRAWSFKTAPLFSSQAGSGTAQTGSDMSICIACEFLGPTTGSNGYAVTIDTQDLQFINCEYEVESGSTTPAGFIHIKANGTRFVDDGGFYSLAGGATNPTNFQVWDTGYVKPTFKAMRVTVGTFNAISAGTPNAAISGNRAELIGGTGAAVNLFEAVGTNKAIVHSQDANNAYAISADTFRYLTAGGSIMLKVDGSGIALGNTSNTNTGTLAQANTGNRIYTLPDSTGTVSLIGAFNASNVAQTLTKMYSGTGTLSSGTPSTVTITMTGGFTGTGTYVVVVTNTTTQANPLKVVQSSATQFTVTGPNTVTDAFNWIAIGT